jgi:peptide/nickel transport system substrate-binding protein
VITNKKWAIAIALVLIASMILTACGPTPTPQVVVQTVKETVVVQGTPQVVEKQVTQVVKETVPVKETVQVKETVAVEVTPTPAPVSRNGGWLDTVVVVEEPSSDSAVTRLNAGELDVYAYTIADSELFQTVKDSPDLVYTQSYGSYNELTLNPCGPVLTGTQTLNPFGDAKIREALNYLIDRNYIVQEIMGGLAVPKFFPITSGFPDYARYVDIVRQLEAKYAYDPAKAEEIITTEMESLGATMVDGKWQYNGAPVTVIFLIRTEDERRDIGDYVSNQLENVGFTVDRQYKTSAEASPLWVYGNPCDGQWNLYTGGWITTAVDRDQGSNFLFFYSPKSGYGFSPLWQNYKVTPEFDKVLTALNNNDFSTMDERRALFEEALPLAMQNSERVWLVDRKSFTPRRADTEVVADLAGAIAGSRLYPYTLRFANQVGGSLTMAMPSILTDPWNPIAGSNWIYDTAVQRAAADVAVMPDPYTGLYHPQRVESVDVVVQEGLPVAKTLDYVSLEFQPEIQVPDDAWVDWDATNQVFLTAADVYTQPTTAKSKTTITYQSDLFQKVKWHDGSPLSVGDFVMRAIMLFDQAKPDSAIYDESQVPNVENFLTHFKGLRITSEDPLVIEWYDDTYYLDAELMVPNNVMGSGWPNYGYGEAGWDAIAMGNLAEASKELAYSPDKADALKVDSTNYIGGPSLEILKKYLDQAQADNLIPYAPTMSKYVTADEATARWANLEDWYGKWGHFWVGTGPYYLQGVFPVEGTVILKQNANFPDPSDKWAVFGPPMLATVELDGPSQVSIGSEATFDVFVTYEGAPYAPADIDEVKYLVFDATGALALTGSAELVADGQYQVMLSADDTAKLAAGSDKLEVAVVPNVVSVPSFASIEFITAP